MLPLPALLLACADITPIEDGFSHGPVTVVEDWFTSASVVRTDGAPVMIDAGFRQGRMTRGLDDQGVDAATVQAVLLTHGHGDHVGALDAYPSATLVGLAAEAGVLEEDEQPALDQALDGDTVLTYDGVDIEVIGVPGHTPGSAVYLVGGALLLGDTALITRDGTLAPVPEKRSDDPAQAIASLVALAARLEARSDEVDWLVPSHSGPSPGLDALLDFAAEQGE